MKVFLFDFLARMYKRLTWKFEEGQRSEKVFTSKEEQLHPQTASVGDRGFFFCLMPKRKGMSTSGLAARPFPRIKWL